MSAAEGQRFQEKIEEMKRKLSTIDVEEIKRGMRFFGDREKARELKAKRRRARLGAQPPNVPLEAED